MNDQEVKNLLTVYQQKVNELTTQTVALEARLMNSSQLVEALNKKLNELSEENKKLLASKSKKITKENPEEDFA
jgi:hypothetical protein